MKTTKTTGVALAVAAAGMFAMAPMSVTVADEGKVHCYGINGCKGKSACKGQGFLNVSSKEECDKAGGKLKEDE